MTIPMPDTGGFVSVELGSRMLYIPSQPTAAHQSDTDSAHVVRSNQSAHQRTDPTHHYALSSAQSGAQAVGRRPMRAWPVLVLALPAFVAIWSGWVGLGQLTGFGPVQPLPGIWDGTINTAVTLPIGMETYASYALFVWLSGRIRSDQTRSYAKYSAIGSLGLGALGQIAYHLLRAAGVTAAPWQVTVLVACLPVAVLGMGAALAHMIRREHDAADERTASAPTVRSDADPVRSADAARTATVREVHPDPRPALAAPPTQAPVAEIEAPLRTANAPSGAHDRWTEIADTLRGADPAGRRDTAKVAAILRLKYERNWSHARIAEHVQLSPSAVTRTLTAARDLVEPVEVSND